MLDYFVVNAFTERPFAGNPAGVCVLTEQLEAAQMQRIAAENRLPETAFLLGADGHYSLRWLHRWMRSISVAMGRWRRRLW